MNQHYGCFNRPPYVQAYKATGGTEPIPTFGKRKCQFIRTELGKADPRCSGCDWVPGGKADMLEQP